MEWVEVAGKTVEDAIRAGLEELGIESRDQAIIEVLQEPRSGFLGIGGQLAHVKISPKPVQQQRKRRRRRRRSRSGGTTEAADGAMTEAKQQRQNGPSGDGSRGDRRRSTQDRESGRRSGGGGQRKSRSSGRQGKQDDTSGRGKAAAVSSDKEGRSEATIEERAEVAKTFIEGLLDAFGLEGVVATDIDDDILRIDVSGDQTEALVGPKGSVMQSVLEITRTVVQRKTYGAPRMRMDIAGYAERRREALKIYAGKLADKVLSDGGEIMLEPMNPADRKVIHDAVAEIDGVRSFSEGEDPERAVVLAPD